MIIENDTDRKIIETFVSLSEATIRLFYTANQNNHIEIFGLHLLNTLKEEARGMLE